MLRDNLVELIEPMLNSAGADPLALYIHTRTPASDDRLPCLKNPRPEGAESSLTESASSPFQAEPAHREPSLDLQLVWKGKEEQDQKALEVLAVLIYIQERIHPHALIEDLRVQAEERRGRIAFPSSRLQRGRISGTCRVIPA